MSTSISDTYADSAYPSTALQSAYVLRLKGSGGTAYSYLLPKGFATGKDVLTTSAVLEVHTQNSWGACTLTARRVTSNKAYSQLNYNNRPTDTGTGAVAQALGSLAANTLIQVDITSFVDAWAKGTYSNYGIRLDAGATADKRLHSANANYSKFGDFRPRLVVTQYRKPSTPQVLAPSFGRQVSLVRPTLTWVPPSDPLMAQTEYKLQMNATDVWTSPTYDSGWVASSDGQHVVTFDVDDGDTWFWRVMVRNGGLQESSWTPSQEFGRTVKPTFSITQPSGGTWTDSTPPVEWSALSAGTQVKFRVRHFVNGQVFADSLELTGADTSWTSLKALPVNDGQVITTAVSLRDDVDRVATPGDDVWLTETSVWEYSPGATDPFDSITAEKNALLPVPTVTAVRSAGTPDRIDWRRSVDGGPWVSVAIGEGTDFHTTGDDYEFTDVTAPPHHELAYMAVAGSNGIDSTDDPSTLVTIDASEIWFLDAADEDFWVAIAERQESGLQRSQESQVFYPKGANYPTVVVGANRGWEGPIEGGVYGTEDNPLHGRTAQEMRDAFVDKVESVSPPTLRLIIADLNVPVVVTNATPKLRPDAELSFGISCTPVQVDDA
jgi:hypothetical protein